ncbi:flagellar basal body rod protein FlgB [Microbulbifer epialgicus]|uniref:Flagellar basal body rod protein FlgB n=1 Tax=Microbulbifer epialgicus TaxID=393907 RepID=A0ABV4NXB2_9GAMM
MIELIDSIAGSLLNKSLDRTTVENRLIANNIANIDTEGYRPLTTEFGRSYEKIRQALSENDFTDLEKVSSSWKPAEEVSIHPTYHSVSLDQEMVKLANNTLQFQSLSVAKTKLSEILKTAIKGG